VEFVPKSADFSRLIYYDTSGTSAPPLRLPYHPRTVALNHTLAEKALGWYGIAFKRGPEHAIVQLCRQAETWVYPTSYSIWQGALGAKLNLNERHWSQDSARKLLADLKPWLITGTPQSLAEAMAWKLPLKPEAILCGASSLSTALKQQFQQYFACPVLDWYSTTESGPIAATAPDGLLKMLAPDLLVEVLDEKSQPAAQGELVISGGRNPYLPLIRYRTGDTGSFSADTLTQFSARQPVQYQASDGSPVSSVDISRILYQYRWSAACFDGHMITIEPVPGQNFSIEPLLQKLSSLLARPVQGKTSMLFCKGIRWLPESESPKQ
jgi:phenylacetate-CoA ligase